MMSTHLMCVRFATLLLLLLTTVKVTTSLPTVRLLHSRLSFPGKLWESETEESIAMATGARSSADLNNVVVERHLVWHGLVNKEPLLPTSNKLFHQTNHPQRQNRSDRHALPGSRPHVHRQLMRVGCMLGTCQVQNLSYRLYQLIGQSGKEHSSPINPKSPYSYG